ncbi:MAG: T9SS type A sorting domain-containing protein [Crocinitomicaceae bacterium]|nr:T9SS type A sorting domain-containing protein [Crocinitomicaceae bacterium]
MKKIYLICLSVISAGVGMAQTTTGTIEHKPAVSGQDVNLDRPAIVGQDRAPDDIIWIDDFGTPANWTAGGPQNDANNGWTIGSSCNGILSPYNSGNMGTTGDFARLSVEYPSTITQGPLTFTYTGTIPDLTSVPAPHLEWEQYGARFITVQEVQVSTDGGTTWITAGSNADIAPLTAGGGSGYGKPETRRFNLTNAIAGNPANVMLRLFWDGDMNGGNMNYVDYGWFVDNVRIVEGHSYDMEANEAYFVSGAELLEYYMVPTSQLTTIEFSGECTNQGGSTFNGLYLEATVDYAGNVFTGTSATTSLAPLGSDSLIASTMFTPANGTGTYNFQWTFLGDSADTYNSNDILTDAIEVTDYTYSRDNGVASGSINNIVGNTGMSMGIGNVMEFFATGVIGAVDIYIADGDGANQDLIYARIDRYNAGTQEFVWESQTDDYTVTNGDINGWVKLVFDNPIQVNAGDVMLLTANHYGSQDLYFGYAQPTFGGTVLGYDAGAALFGLANPGAVMIRADMRDFTGIEEEGNMPFSIGQNVPNPFDNSSVISYTLDEAANVSVQFTDISGKVIKTINQGNQTAGTYQINIDGNDFATGVYFYTFTIGDQQITKKMTVK